MRLDRSGRSPAVAPFVYGGWCSARVEGNRWVVVEINGVERWRRDVGPLRSVSIGCRADGTLWVAGALETVGGDEAVLVTEVGITYTYRKVVQQRGVFLTPDAGRLAVCEAANACVITSVDGSQTVTSYFPGGTTTAGILGVTWDTAIWAEAVSGGYVKRHGLTLPRDAGRWCFGQIAGPDDAAVWHDGRRQSLIPGQTYEQSAAMFAPDQAVVGVEMEGDRVAFQVVPPWPPIRLPVFATTTARVGIGVFLDPLGPGVTIENNQAMYPYKPGLSKVVFYTLGHDDQAAALAFAKSVNLPALAYLDGGEIEPGMVPPGARAGVYGYPSASETATEVAIRVDRVARRLNAAGVPWDLVAAQYCQYTQPGDYTLMEQQVLDALEALWPLCVSLKAGAIYAFIQRRTADIGLVDGIDYWSSFGETMHRLRNASADWLHFPTVAVPPEPGPEPPEPGPVPPEPPEPEPIAAGGSWWFFMEGWHK